MGGEEAVGGGILSRSLCPSLSLSLSLDAGLTGDSSSLQQLLMPEINFSVSPLPVWLAKKNLLVHLFIPEKQDAGFT